MSAFGPVQREYMRLRMRYYLEADPPLHVPLPARDLRWAWVNARGILGATHFDEEGDPHLIEVPWGVGERVVLLILLHELSHMRNPSANCGTRHRWWREEARRLEDLGAFGREGIF